MFKCYYNYFPLYNVLYLDVLLQQCSLGLLEFIITYINLIQAVGLISIQLVTSISIQVMLC
jgi:hypothetical protein